MEVLFWIVFALGLFFIYMCVMSVHDKIKLERWAFRFRWFYIKRYRLHKKFDSGWWTVGPVLCYKKKAVVYYRESVDKETLELWPNDIYEVLKTHAQMKLLASIPVDFVFDSVQSYEDYDPAFNLYRVTIEGQPIPIEEFKLRKNDA